MQNFQELVAKAEAAYQALSPEQKAHHDLSQRRSFLRGMCPGTTDYAEWCKVVDRVIPPPLDLLSRDELEAEIKRLRAALVEYGRHVPGCARLGPPLQQCDCGLAAAIDGHQQTAPEKKP